MEREMRQDLELALTAPSRPLPLDVKYGSHQMLEPAEPTLSSDNILQQTSSHQRIPPGQKPLSADDTGGSKLQEQDYFQLLVEEGPGYMIGQGPWHVSAKVFDFGGLQRLNVKYLQGLLIKASAEIAHKKTTSAEDLHNICMTLERYGEHLLAMFEDLLSEMVPNRRSFLLSC